MTSQLETNNAAQLWAQAQAQSKALSDRTDQVYNQTVAARPGGVWTNNVQAGPNGSPIYSGSVSPGTYFNTALVPPPD